MYLQVQILGILAASIKAKPPNKKYVLRALLRDDGWLISLGRYDSRNATIAIEVWLDFVICPCPTLQKIYKMPELPLHACEARQFSSSIMSIWSNLALDLGKLSGLRYHWPSENSARDIHPHKNKSVKCKDFPKPLGFPVGNFRNKQMVNSNHFKEPCCIHQVNWSSIPIHEHIKTEWSVSQPSRGLWCFTSLWMALAWDLAKCGPVHSTTQRQTRHSHCVSSWQSFCKRTFSPQSEC